MDKEELERVRQRVIHTLKNLKDKYRITTITTKSDNSFSFYPDKVKLEFGELFLEITTLSDITISLYYDDIYYIQQGIMPDIETVLS